MEMTHRGYIYVSFVVVVSKLMVTSYLGHLIVNLAESRCHLVCESTSDNHDVGLTRRSTENDSHAILVVTWGGKMHHLDGAAGETESHRP